MTTVDYFTRIGETIEQRWRTHGFDEDAFPEVAANVLREVEPASFTSTTVLTDAATLAQLPLQEDPRATFGQPPITLFRSERFYVSVLYWLDATTVIHEHRFSGAFRVFEGSSIHTSYAFEQQEAVDPDLLVGTLSLEGSEYLVRDDVREIRPGANGIHALFHLDRPSATIVVRTYGTRSDRPQFTHTRTGLAFNPTPRDTQFDRVLQSLAALRSIDTPEAMRVGKRALRQLDPFRSFRVLDDWSRSDRGDTLRELVDEFGRVHPHLAPLVAPAFDELRREHSLASRRRLVRDRRHRLFLALLMNLPDARRVRDLLAAIYPGEDASELLVELLRELASPEQRGASGLVLDQDELDTVEAALRSGATTTLKGLSDRVRRSDVLSRLLA